MGAGNMFVSREQYVEMLIDSFLQDVAEIEKDFLSWCEKHVPTWREQGRDETWIRLRIEMAQTSRGLHRTLKERDMGMLEIREELRKTYADSSDLYELAKKEHRDLLRYRGDAWDLRQRYSFRVLLYEADKLAHKKYCLWSGLPVPGPDVVFCEPPESRVVRDLSTVEELEMMLEVSRYLSQLLDAPEPLAADQITARMYAHGEQLRAIFIERQGYPPEESTTPYLPVTIDGPTDHDSYYAKEFPDH
jgi:hypothetical protein